MTEAEENNDLTRVKALLERTSEFIAYFELVEEKMKCWQQDMEAQAEQHANRYKKQNKALEQELEALHQLLSQTGIQEFQEQIKTVWKQSEKQRAILEKKGQDLLEQMRCHSQHHERLSEKSIENIEQHTAEAIKRLEARLAQYDAKQFHRIADESCMYIEKYAQETIHNNQGLLQSVKKRFLWLTLLSTLITASVIGWYLNDELPWETHQQVTNEREAGRLLLQAWPNMAHHEKLKILGKRQ